MSALAEIQSHKADGDRHFRDGQHQSAVDSYDKAIEASEQSKDPSLLAALYSNRSAAKLVLKDDKGALADAQASVAVDDKWIKGWYRSAKALQGLNKLDLAIQAAQRARELEPHNKDVLSLIRELQRCSRPTAPDSTANTAASSSSSSNTAHRHRQQQQEQLPVRGSLNLQLLPQALVTGSEYLPSPDGLNSNLLLLLHGLGDRPAAFTALAQRMQLPQTACLALSGPLEVPEIDGGRAWFTAFDDEWNLIQPRPGEKRRLTSLAATLQLLEQLLAALSAAGGWQLDQLQLLGFSQGGTAALELARKCTGNKRLGGVVAISASLLEEGLEDSSSASQEAAALAAPAATATGASRGCNVLIAHGECDEVIPHSLVKRSMAALQQSGCDVQLHSLPSKGHGMPGSAAEMRVLMAFWAKHLQSRPSDPGFVPVPGRFPDSDTAARAAAAAAAHQGTK